MSVFTDNEIAFLDGSRLGRLATVGQGGEPHVVPVGFSFNAETDTIDIRGYRMGSSKKWRDAGRDSRVAFVVDDVLPSPRRPRGVEVRGRAELVRAAGADDSDHHADLLIRIHPRRIVSWGIDSDAYTPNSRPVHP